MVLDDLQGVIEKLRKTIEMHRDYLHKNETGTRQLLIDPLLRELGWDVSDSTVVQLEYSVGQQRVDYALMSNGQPVAMVEAKSLGSNLKDREMGQALGYANVAGISYALVTDGDKWEMYEVFKQAALEERLLMKLELSRQPAHKSALQALTMWWSNLTSEEPVFVSLKPAPDQPSRKPNKPPEQPPEDSDNWCTFESKLYPQHTTPIQLQIGVHEKPVNNWREVIHEVVVWLVKKQILRDSDCPVKIGQRTFIGREAANPNGTSFRQPQSLPNDLILQRGITTVLQWKRLWRLLRQFKEERNVDPSQIRVLHSQPR